MEYISGEDLETCRKRNPPSVAQALRWAKKLCGILAYLHSQSPPVIHGDIKPANLLLSGEDRLYLVDFGAARRGYREKGSLGKGTAAFAAPEQREGRAAPQTDLFGLGKTLEALLDSRRLPHRVKRLLQKCTHPRMKLRYQSAEVLERELDKVLAKQEGRRAIHWWPTAVLLAGLLAGALAGQGVGGNLEKNSQEEKEAQPPAKREMPGRQQEEAGREALPDAFEKGAPEAGEALAQVMDGLREQLRRAAREGGSLGGEKLWAGLWELSRLTEEGLEEREKKEALLFLGSLYRGLGMDEEAGAVYQRMVDCWPFDPECRALLGETLLRLGKREESLELYRNGQKAQNAQKNRKPGRNYRIWERDLEVKGS